MCGFPERASSVEKERESERCREGQPRGGRGVSQWCSTDEERERERERECNDPPSMTQYCPLLRLPNQTSQEVTHPGIALAEARLTAEF
jgi:hypothetical protein